MSFIYEILPDRIINALGWTILHSFWQGLIIGILLFLLLYFYRYHSSRLRYNLSVFSLILIFGFCLLTFAINFRDIGPTGLQTYQEALELNHKNDINQSQIYSGIRHTVFNILINSIAGTVSGTFPFIITLWLLGVCIFTARMTGGLLMTQRLRNSCLYAIPEDIQERFRKLTDLMKIPKLVRIFESTLISVPVVIGYFKPMILLPFSAVSQIPCDQLEAIIAHELAHIRRNDYMVNVFQSVTEALFFYHPLVWIINRRIRIERENCCDDLAVVYSGGRITYAKALASIHEIPDKHGFPLLALGSKKYYLLSRVLRILKQGKMKTNLKDKLFAGFVLTSAIVIILLNTGGTFINFNSSPKGYIKTNDSVQISETKDLVNQVNPAPVIRVNINAKPVPKAKVVIQPAIQPGTAPDTTLKVKDNVIQRTFMKDGREMNLKMKIEQGKVKELYVNGEKIPEEEYGKYQAEVDKTLEDLTELQKKLTEACEEIEELNMEEIRKEIEESMKEVRESMQEIDIEQILEDIEEIEIPEIDEEKIKMEIESAIAEIEAIDTEKIREEIETAMESAHDALNDIEVPDLEEIKMEMELAIEKIEEIDHEKIMAEIEESISEIKIDREEIRIEIEEAIKELQEINIDAIKMDIEKERNKMDEMLREIEKLELERK